MTDGWTVPGFAQVRDLAQAGDGSVVLAVDEVTKTEVVIKRLGACPDTVVERLRKLPAVEDPNLVAVYDAVTGPAETALVMEYVPEAVTLRKIIATQGSTGPEAALTVFSGALLALVAAHAADIPHGTISPERILVGKDGMPRLTGLALGTPGAGATIGVPAYLAPQQWSGSLPDTAGDLYAATAVFFECLTGHPPYPGRKSGELARAHQTNPIPVDEVPAGLRQLVTRGLAKHTPDRPGSAADFLVELDEAASAAYGSGWESQGRGKLSEMSQQAAAMPDPKPASGRRQKAAQPAAGGGETPRKGRRGLLVAAAVVVVVAAAGAAVVVLRGGDGTAAAVPESPQPTVTPSATASAQVTPPLTPQTLVARIQTALAGRQTAGFNYTGPGGTGGATDGISANGVFKGTAYDMTVGNPGDKHWAKRVRTLLVGSTGYQRDGKVWKNAPAGRTPSKQDALHVYASMAANVRSAGSLANLLALLRGSQQLSRDGQDGLGYSGTATTATLAKDPLWKGYPAGKYKLSYTLTLDDTDLPTELKITLRPAKGAALVFDTTYRGWGRKAAISAP